MAIDLGVSNLATIVAVSKTEKLHPILIKGGALKSFNAKYNKHVAFLKSKKKYKTKSKIDYNRETKFRDAFHQISHLIIEYALDHHIHWSQSAMETEYQYWQSQQSSILFHSL